MRLHSDVRVQMVESSVGLFTAVPAALVHALNFFIATSGPLVLLRAWNGNERVDGRERVAALQIDVRNASCEDN